MEPCLEMTPSGPHTRQWRVCREFYLCTKRFRVHSWSGHIPRLHVRSLIRHVWEATNWCFSLTPMFLSLCKKKINKYIFKTFFKDRITLNHHNVQSTHLPKTRDFASHLSFTSYHNVKFILHSNQSNLLPVPCLSCLLHTFAHAFACVPNSFLLHSPRYLLQSVSNSFKFYLFLASGFVCFFKLDIYNSRI